jgi:hypothetical protein
MTCSGGRSQHIRLAIWCTTIGFDAGHTDVSLWFVCEGKRDMRMTVDEVEFQGARWWSLDEVTEASGEEFDPHFRRFMRKVVAVR